MNNSALNLTEDEDFQVFSMAMFVIKQCIWAAHALLVLYLGFALTLFETQRNKYRSDLGTPHSSGRKISRRRNTTSTGGAARRSFWLNIFGENPMCLLTLFSIALRCILLQIEFNYGSTSKIICKVFGTIYTLLGTGGHFGVYVLLWARQWGLYNTNPIKTLLTTTLRAVNIGVLVGLATAGVFMTSMFIFSFNKFLNTPNGCLYQETSDEKKVVTITTGVFVVCSVVFQACLLALTVYPLSKHYGSMWFCCRGKSPKINMSSSLQRVQKVVRRISISCAVCVGTDLLFGIAMGIQSMIYDNRTTFLLMSNNLNMVVNLVAVVGSFSDWMERLFPWKRRPRVAGIERYRSTASEGRGTTDGVTAVTPIKTPERSNATRINAKSNDISEVAESSNKLMEETTSV